MCLMIFLKLLSRLPLWALYGITDGVRLLIYYLIGYRKSVVIQNIKNAFPDKSEEEIKKITKEFYQRFCEYMAETIKAITISEKEMLKRVKFLNVPLVQSYADKNQSIILAGSHQFNWEWALLTGCLVLPFPVDAVYKKLSNRKFDQLMLDTRGKFGGQPIESKSLIRSLIKSKLRTKAVAIIADQSPKKKRPKLLGYIYESRYRLLYWNSANSYCYEIPSPFLQNAPCKKGLLYGGASEAYRSTI